MDTTSNFSSQWRWKAFGYYHLTALLLTLSWIIPDFRSYWDTLDVYVFRALNDPLRSCPLYAYFCALANLKLAGIISVVFLALFFILYITDGTPTQIAERIAQFLYTCLWCELGILGSKQVASWILHALDFSRDSPTVVLKECVMLSQFIPWLDVKDFSFSSFPSDHAVMALQWLGFVCFFCPVVYRLPAGVVALLFCLPRLIGGAHWISDIAVGSSVIVCCILAWATCSPIYFWVMPYLVRLCAFLMPYNSQSPLNKKGS